MTLTWSDLSWNQRRLLIKLSDDFPHEDSVGVPARQIKNELLLTASSLVKLGFVEVWFGWRGIAWLRLTEAGRQV